MIGAPEPEGSTIVLYRCPTKTNYLCPCGAVDRRLRKLGIEYRTERVPYRRSHRPEIVELTGQSRVPTLRLPPQLAVGGARLSEQLHLGLGLSVDETRSAALWWTYSSAKAKRELGFAARPHEETLEAALEMTAAQLGDRVGADPGPAGALLEVAGRASQLASRLLP